MKKLLIFLPAILIGLILGFGFTTDNQNQPKNKALQQVSTDTSSHSLVIVPNNVVWSMIGQVNQDRALTDLRKLTGEEQICLDKGCYTITNRLTGSQGLQWAKDYVYQELVKLDYSVEIQDWSDSGYADQNIIVRKPGIISPDEEIYFVAHMDGAKTSPAADDDASGVVSLLELARIIRSRAISNTVVLLFSTGEEQGALGAISYVDKLTQEQLNAISYVVNVDMLGYDSTNDGAIELWNGSQPLDFVQLLSDIISTYQLGLIPQIVSDCG